MVTTGHDRANLVTGLRRKVVDLEELSHKEWAYCIGYAAKQLTLTYLSGLSSMRQLLEVRHLGSVPIPIFFESSLLPKSGISDSEMYLSCGALKPLPPPGEWEQVRGKYRKLTEKLLLLKRLRQRHSEDPLFDFYELVITYKPVASGPTSHWLETSSLHLKWVELEDVAASLGNGRNDLGKSMLKKFAEVQEVTAEVMRQRLKVARDNSVQLRGIAERVGVYF